jgi:DNA-binding transcriptional ArsR family regulator
MSATKLPSLDDLTVEQLEAALAAKRKSQIDSLRDERASLLEQLKAVDKQLEAAGVGVPGAARVGRGGGGGGGGSGASGSVPGRRGVPMATLVVRAILASGEKDVSVTEIVERVSKHGSSSNPKTAVGQALVKLKKTGLVDSPSRGAYRVTASGKKLAAAEAGS